MLLVHITHYSLSSFCFQQQFDWGTSLQEVTGGMVDLYSLKLFIIKQINNNANDEHCYFVSSSGSSSSINFANVDMSTGIFRYSTPSIPCSQSQHISIDAVLKTNLYLCDAQYIAQTWANKTNIMQYIWLYPDALKCVNAIGGNCVTWSAVCRVYCILDHKLLTDGPKFTISCPLLHFAVFTRTSTTGCFCS